MRRGIRATALILILVSPALSLSQTQSTISPGTPVLIGAPKKIPDGLLEALKGRLMKNADVAEAYLALIFVKREGEIPRLLLFLRVQDAPDFAKDLIRDELGNASRAFLAEGESIDILTEDTPGISAAIKQAVKPFYVRGK